MSAQADEDRAAFEAWITPKLRAGSNLKRSLQHGVYMDNRVAAKWAAWQAAAAYCRKPPEPGPGDATGPLTVL